MLLLAKTSSLIDIQIRFGVRFRVDKMELGLYSQICYISVLILSKFKNFTFSL